MTMNGWFVFVGFWLLILQVYGQNIFTGKILPSFFGVFFWQFKLVNYIWFIIIENICNNIAIESSFSCPPTHHIYINSYDLKFIKSGGIDMNCFTPFDYSITKAGTDLERYCIYDFNMRSTCRLRSSSIQHLFKAYNIDRLYYQLPKRIAVKYSCLSNFIK